MVILRQKIKGQPYSQGTESLFSPQVSPCYSQIQKIYLTYMMHA